MVSFVLSFFPLDVLDEIWDLIESLSEGISYLLFQLERIRYRRQENQTADFLFFAVKSFLYLFVIALEALLLLFLFS